MQRSWFSLIWFLIQFRIIIHPLVSTMSTLCNNSWCRSRAVVLGRVIPSVTLATIRSMLEASSPCPPLPTLSPPQSSSHHQDLWRRSSSTCLLVISTNPRRFFFRSSMLSSRNSLQRSRCPDYLLNNHSIRGTEERSLELDSRRTQTDLLISSVLGSVVTQLTVWRLEMCSLTKKLLTWSKAFK